VQDLVCDHATDSLRSPPTLRAKIKNDAGQIRALGSVFKYLSSARALLLDGKAIAVSIPPGTIFDGMRSKVTKNDAERIRDQIRFSSIFRMLALWIVGFFWLTKI
jgi:hypothetical protein